MRISVKRTGGFAGLSEEVASVDTELLNAAWAQRVEQMVRDARFFDLPAHIPGRTIGADLLLYEMTITEGNRRHTVTFDEDSPESAPLRSVVTALTQR